MNNTTSFTLIDRSEFFHQSDTTYKQHLSSLMIIHAIYMVFAQLPWIYNRLVPALVDFLPGRFNLENSLLFITVIPLVIPVVSTSILLAAILAASDALLNREVNLLRVGQTVFSVKNVIRVIILYIASLIFFSLSLFLILIPVIGWLILLPLLIFLSFKLSFVYHVMILENAGIIQSIKRSWYLTTDLLGTIFSVIILRAALPLILGVFLTAILLTFIIGAIMGIDFWYQIPTYSLFVWESRFDFEAFAQVFSWVAICVNILIGLRYAPVINLLTVTVYYYSRAIRGEYTAPVLIANRVLSKSLS